MQSRGQLILFTLMLIISGCATAMPQGPTITVLPAQGKPFAQFQSEDTNCRKWAVDSTGITPRELHNQDTLTGAGIGTLIGSGVGALLGSASGHMGAGAAIGAGTGLLIGSTIGSDTGRINSEVAQRRYDTAYLQCMLSNGNQIFNQRVYTLPEYYQRRRVIMIPSEEPPVYYVPPAYQQSLPPAAYPPPPSPLASPRLTYPPPGTPPPPGN